MVTYPTLQNASLRVRYLLNRFFEDWLNARVGALLQDNRSQVVAAGNPPYAALYHRANPFGMKQLIPIVFTLLGLQGCTQPVAELPGAGHWRVINYWAIWCAPCREEIPELNALDDSTELMIFAVNYDGQNGEALQSQAAEMGIKFTLLEQDPGTALGIERPRVLPTTLLVNPQGAVTDTLVGPQTQESLSDVWQGRAAR